ncbi:MAG TPA: LamG-like jellyroll fold domain-containing protein, partial [Polyangia bacterium]|nr:LamG-like jellyroll fold domain-containing protein [Polyangia bacterium]
LTCSSSICAACPALQTACGGSCTTTDTDNNNCGSCGHVCNTAGGESCVSGVCACSSGTDCSGSCTVTATDPNNCGACGLACGMPTSSGIDSGLLGHWKLDEGSGTTSADASGNGNTATLTSSANWTAGYSGEAFSGDGTNYVSANLGTWFGSNNTLTASAWVYAASTTNGPLFGVTSIPAGGGWNMPFLSIAGPTAYGHIWMVNGNTPLSATVGLNAWHFLAITYDPSGSGTERFYVDGALSVSGTGTYQASGLTDTWSTNIPGTKPTGVSGVLTGKVDDVRAYNRVLSAAEISIIYNARQTCSASTCGGCAGGETICSGVCTNKALDPGNCGTCGTTCNAGGGETCISSGCGCASGTDCSGTCIDTTTDNANCGSCGHICSTVTCASCSQGLLGLWHLDEGSGSTSADSSGTGNDLTLVGSPNWVTGEAGDGLQLNGTNYMYANIGTPFTTSTTISANAWVFATSSTNGPIFGVSQTTTGSVWDMPFLSINGSTVYGWLWQVNGNNPLAATVTLNAWHMLTITYDPSGSGTESFYVDGVLSSSGTGTFVGASTGMMTPVSVYLITSIPGAKPPGVNSVLTGTIDELRGYTRVLSAGEISLLYNARQTCVASSCGGCPTGTTLCTSVCTNLQADKNNCNSCGHACTSGQTCVAGACM